MHDFDFSKLIELNVLKFKKTLHDRQQFRGDNVFEPGRIIAKLREEPLALFSPLPGRSHVCVRTTFVGDGQTSGREFEVFVIQGEVPCDHFTQFPIDVLA